MQPNKPQGGGAGRREMERSSGQQPARSMRTADPFGFTNSNPFSLMRHMQSEMDRLFAQAFGGLGAGFNEGGSGGGMTSWSPAIEVSEREGNLKVCAELPGIKPEEVKVEITPEALIIEGERKTEQESNEGGMRRTERHYGRFHRTIPLPEGVEAEQARAQFTNGVLEIDIPIPQQRRKGRQIPISGA